MIETVLTCDMCGRSEKRSPRWGHPEGWVRLQTREGAEPYDFCSFLCTSQWAGDPFRLAIEAEK